MQIAKAIAVARGELLQAASFAEARYGLGSRAALALKAAAEAGSIAPSSDGWGEALAPYTIAANEWLEVVAEASVLGRIGAVRVPRRVRVPVEGDGETGTWIVESGPIAVSDVEIGAAFTETDKLGAIVVFSDELMRLDDVRAEALVRRRLLRSFVTLRDRQFLDAGASAAGAPDPATAGVTAIASTGNPHDDLRLLVEAFEGDLQGASIVSDPRTIAAMALWRDGGGAAAFPILNVRTGGEVIGLPVVASRASPLGSSGGQLALIDGGAILMSDDAPALDFSRHATLQMNSTPDDPSTAATVMVSLWARNLIGLRCVQYVSWRVARAGAVALVEGASYPAAS